MNLQDGKRSHSRNIKLGSWVQLLQTQESGKSESLKAESFDKAIKPYRH